MTLLRSPNDKAFDELPLLTRKRRPIPNEWGYPQKPPQAMDAADQNFKGMFGARIQRRASASTYNCCGLVFANRRTAIDPDDLKVLLDDEYQVIAEVDATIGDVVVYRDSKGNVAHVGVIIEKRLLHAATDDNLLILSQWGLWGEYIHPSRDVPPSFGSVSEFWTERNV